MLDLHHCPWKTEQLRSDFLLPLQDWQILHWHEDKVDKANGWSVSLSAGFYHNQTFVKKVQEVFRRRPISYNECNAFEKWDCAAWQYHQHQQDLQQPAGDQDGPRGLQGDGFPHRGHRVEKLFDQKPFHGSQNLSALNSLQSWGWGGWWGEGGESDWKREADWNSHLQQNQQVWLNQPFK